jgi:hypothetical protein
MLFSTGELLGGGGDALRNAQVYCEPTERSSRRPTTSRRRGDHADRVGGMAPGLGAGDRAPGAAAGRVGVGLNSAGGGEGRARR